MSQARPRVTALIDRSAYGVSVGEHAAWLAERIDAALQLRHVRETHETVEDAKALLSQAFERLADQGAASPDLSLVEGGVLAGAISAEAAVLVMGKRGEGSAEGRTALGRHVELVLRALDIPVCLASQLFLPIHRVLAVTDADPQRHAALDLLAAGHGLDNLAIDLIVVAGAHEDPEAKLSLARGMLDGRATSFAVQTEDIGSAIWRYLDERPADLIIISRAVLLGGGVNALAASAESLWAARASVLVC
ncbi:hypothetical protein [Caulobacter segnis]|uniref:UspA domain-containing protein n=1 Tax=Caulobacter segnis TaxID=88688 RepID=A0A2W5X2W2_9CAUL|nr:hypothetical protein [Caulobacter segnis]PZR30901.1 MAG: hypothetical protein DI526_21235 [Caulobacter segnis]